MQISHMTEPALSPEMAAYVASIPIDDEPETDAERSARVEAIVDARRYSTAEVGVRCAVMDAIHSVTGGSWLVGDLRRHVAQLEALPLGWGDAELVKVLDRMVQDQLISSDAGHYYAHGAKRGGPLESA